MSFRRHPGARTYALLAERRLALPHRISNWPLTSLHQRLVKTGGREAGETCPQLLVVDGGGSSDPAAVRSDVAKDGGSHDPRRVAPPVAAMKKSRSQERPHRKWCLENPVPSVATTGFEDFWKGGSEPITLSEKKLCSVGRKWEYAFNRRKAKKLIPDWIAGRGLSGEHRVEIGDHG